jgi:hypothetical protein
MALACPKLTLHGWALARRFRIVRWFGVWVLLHTPLVRVQKARGMCASVVTWVSVKVRRAFSISGSPAVGD